MCQLGNDDSPLVLLDDGEVLPNKLVLRVHSLLKGVLQRIFGLGHGDDCLFAAAAAAAACNKL